MCGRGIRERTPESSLSCFMSFFRPLSNSPGKNLPAASNRNPWQVSGEISSISKPGTKPHKQTSSPGPAGSRTPRVNTQTIHPFILYQTAKGVSSQVKSKSFGIIPRTRSEFFYIFRGLGKVQASKGQNFKLLLLKVLIDKRGPYPEFIYHRIAEGFENMVQSGLVRAWSALQLSYFATGQVKIHPQAGQGAFSDTTFFPEQAQKQVFGAHP